MSCIWVANITTCAVRGPCEKLTTDLPSTVKLSQYQSGPHSLEDERRNMITDFCSIKSRLWQRITFVWWIGTSTAVWGNGAHVHNTYLISITGICILACPLTGCSTPCFTCILNWKIATRSVPLCGHALLAQTFYLYIDKSHLHKSQFSHSSSFFTTNILRTAVSTW
jgi:hypothetical protein